MTHDDRERHRESVARDEVGVTHADTDHTHAHFGTLRIGNVDFLNVEGFADGTDDGCGGFHDILSPVNQYRWRMPSRCRVIYSRLRPRCCTPSPCNPRCAAAGEARVGIC